MLLVILSASPRIFCIRHIQSDLFAKEIAALKQHNLSSNNKLLALRPFLHGKGVLRVGGRLNRAPVSYAVKHPILIASHPLVYLTIDHAHKRSLHAGLQLTLNMLRAEFWIVRARSVTKSVLHKCIACTRERAALPSQLMRDLPPVRVSAPEHCFLHVGLDYAGPIQIKALSGRGIATRKAYIALFVCLASRAIHLETVSDYFTPAFLHAFSRFTSRRGLPASVYSDNGTTFVGADCELTRSYREALHDPQFLNAIATDQVAWHFLPPAASHFGGIWEAGVKNVKHHLRRVLGNNILTYEEFSTLFCHIEACLNSRPIAPLTDSLEDYESLTPGHVLVGSAVTAVPEPSLFEVNENRLSRWQQVRQMHERFWKLWSSDYVNTLQQRKK